MSLERRLKKALFGDETVLKDRKDLIDAARLQQLSEVTLDLLGFVANAGSMAESTVVFATYKGRFNGLPFSLRTYRFMTEEGVVLDDHTAELVKAYRAELPAVAVMRNAGCFAGVSFMGLPGTDDGYNVVCKAAGKEVIIPYIHRDPTATP